MDKIDARTLPLTVLNERRRRAVKLRESGMTLREVDEQAELSVPTVMAAHSAYLSGGWSAGNVKREVANLAKVGHRPKWKRRESRR